MNELCFCFPFIVVNLFYALERRDDKIPNRKRREKLDSSFTTEPYTSQLKSGLGITLG